MSSIRTSSSPSAHSTNTQQHTIPSSSSTLSQYSAAHSPNTQQHTLPILSSTLSQYSAARRPAVPLVPHASRAVQLADHALYNSPPIRRLDSSRIGAVDNSRIGPVYTSRHLEDRSRLHLETGPSRPVPVDTSRTGAIDNSRFGVVDHSRIGPVDTSRIRVIDTSRIESIDASRLGPVDTSMIGALDNSRIGALDGSRIAALDTSRLGLVDGSRIGLVDNSRTGPLDASRLGALDSSQTGPVDTSRFDARDNSRIGALDNSMIGAVDNSRMRAVDASRTGPVDTSRLGLVASFRWSCNRPLSRSTAASHLAAADAAAATGGQCSGREEDAKTAHEEDAKTAHEEDTKTGHDYGSGLLPAADDSSLLPFAGDAMLRIGDDAMLRSSLPSTSPRNRTSRSPRNRTSRSPRNSRPINFLTLLHPSSSPPPPPYHASSPPYHAVVSRIIKSSDQRASRARTSGRQQKLKVADAAERGKTVDAIYLATGPCSRSGKWTVQRCLEAAATADEKRKIRPDRRAGDELLRMPHIPECAGLEEDIREEDIRLLIVSELLHRDPAQTLHAFENLEDAAKDGIVDEILHQGLAVYSEVCKNQWGLYCVQHFLEHGSDKHRQMTLDHLISGLLEYATNEQGSKSVTKALKEGGKDTLDRVIKRMCEPAKTARRVMIVDLALSVTGSQLIAIREHPPDGRQGPAREVVRLHPRTYRYVPGLQDRLDLAFLPDMAASPPPPPAPPALPATSRRLPPPLATACTRACHRRFPPPSPSLAAVASASSPRAVPPALPVHPIDAARNDSRGRATRLAHFDHEYELHAADAHLRTGRSELARRLGGSIPGPTQCLRNVQSAHAAHGSPRVRRQGEGHSGGKAADVGGEGGCGWRGEGRADEGERGG
ncbi:hypothetical protein BD626DRAFT_575208 [Schizophyllum amplum]|uniref:PUM-HD domain-containing protein n=1 Tax=Schizophyllum amplum TaxID=97359 RepID=A0A550BW27_9AGAR|nr:hypothetical protein BD626DRAFT_575208 [Auriculariopsis ampla]